MSFADLLLEAPNGVLLLALLELDQRGEPPIRRTVAAETDAEAVRSAAEAVGVMSLGALLTAGAHAATRLGGPWNPGAIPNLVASFACAPARRPIAEAIAERFEVELTRAPDLLHQEVWICGHHLDDRRRCFVDFEQVYGNGEFTWAAFRTASPHPEGSSVEFSVTTDGACDSTLRWRVPVTEEERVWRIDGPQDWVRLVATYPRPAPREHSGWELPGPNQNARADDGIAELERRSDGRAARTRISRHLLPDWRAVAADFDGVHLSWAGYLTTEGLISEVDDDAVTMLRYWDGEQTHWLRDVFGPPEPLGPRPTVTVASPPALVDPGMRDRADRLVLEARLGRGGAG